MSPSAASPDRLVYGRPGEPVMLAVECVRTAGDAAPARIRISRHAPADRDAGALLALIGNGAIGRMEVAATKQGQRQIWQGELPAEDRGWEPLAGPLPMQFLRDCRSPLAEPPPPPAPAG